MSGQNQQAPQNNYMYFSSLLQLFVQIKNLGKRKKRKQQQRDDLKIFPLFFVCSKLQWKRFFFGKNMEILTTNHW